MLEPAKRGADLRAQEVATPTSPDICRCGGGQHERLALPAQDAVLLTPREHRAELLPKMAVLGIGEPVGPAP